MSILSYGGTAATGNQTNLQAVVQLLKSVDAVEILDKFVLTIPVPMNKTETVGFLRAVTPDPNVNEVAEGVNPAPRALTYEQVTKTFEEYAEVFAITSRQAELGEYDVLMHSKDRLMDLIKRTREKNAWFQYRGNGTNVIYNAAAITARTAVNGALTLGRIRLAVRGLNNNRASVIREMSKGSVNIGTFPVEPAYVALTHTDAQQDIRNLSGFVPAVKVGGLKDYMPELFGYLDNVAIVCSPEFEPFYAGGAAVGATGMKSVGGVNIDVYAMLIIGREALGKVNLRGAEGSNVKLSVLDKADKSDPTNQRRLVAARWWDAPVILNQQWLYRLEFAVTDQPT